MPVGLILMAVSLAATAYGAYQTHQAGKTAQEAADRQARLDEQANEEAVRRLEKQQAETEATAKARAQAAGFEGESFAPALQEMEKEHKREASWERRAGKSRTDLTRWQGGQARKQATSKAWGMLAQGAGQASGVNW